MGRRATSPKGKQRRQVTARPQVARKRGSTVNELERRLADALKREAEVLDQQIATSEILRVIAGAETDPQPVFDTIAANALVLCRAASSLVTRFDGEMLHVVAIHNVDPKGAEAHKHNYPMPLSRSAAAARAMLTRAVAHVVDVLEDADYAYRDVAQAAGYRTVLAVPMLRDGTPIGAITVFGVEAAMFSERQVELLKTFADQAVIAVENTRLFNELRERTDELTRSVGQLTALGEVGRAVGSTLDLETVLSTIVERAVQLSVTDGGIIYDYDEPERTFGIKAWHQTEPEHLEALRATPIRFGEGALGRAAAAREPVEVEDILSKESPIVPQTRFILGRFGYQSLLAIPLLREDRILGGL